MMTDNTVSATLKYGAPRMKY